MAKKFVLRRGAMLTNWKNRSLSLDLDIAVLIELAEDQVEEG